MQETKIIDAWMQHPTRKFINHPMFASLRRWSGAAAGVEIDPPAVEETVAMMDRDNISLGLMCSWQNQEGALISNDDVAAMVELFPDRFAGIASVPLNRPVQAVRELRKYVKDYGFKGLRVVQWHWNLPATHAYYYPLFVECVELNIPVCLQVGHTGPLMPSETGRPIPYIDQIALDFPDLKIVCGHIGYPWTTEMIAVATKHPNVYIDTSAYTVKRYPAELVAYLKNRGRKKVLFGSNFPMITPGKCLENLADLDLDASAANDFLCQNAVRVFNLDL